MTQYNDLSTTVCSKLWDTLALDGPANGLFGLFHLFIHLSLDTISITSMDWYFCVIDDHVFFPVIPEMGKGYECYQFDLCICERRYVSVVLNPRDMVGYVGVK